MGVPVSPEDILTPQQLADRLQVSLTWVREKMRHRAKHPLPAIRLGRYLRFNWADIEVWLEERKRPQPFRPKKRRRKVA